MNQPIADDQIRVVVIEDHPVYRAGLKSTLGRQPDVAVVADGISASDAVNLVREHSPDVLLLDLDIPGGGLRAAEAISAAHPNVKTVILTARMRDDLVYAAHHSGASGYVVKGVGARELARTIRAVYEGATWWPA